MNDDEYQLALGRLREGPRPSPARHARVPAALIQRPAFGRVDATDSQLAAAREHFVPGHPGSFDARVAALRGYGYGVDYGIDLNGLTIGDMQDFSRAIHGPPGREWAAAIGIDPTSVDVLRAAWAQAWPKAAGYTAGYTAKTFPSIRKRRDAP